MLAVLAVPRTTVAAMARGASVRRASGMRIPKAKQSLGQNVRREGFELRPQPSVLGSVTSEIPSPARRCACSGI